MKWTSPLRSSRLDGQKTYMEHLIRSPDEEVMPSERCLVVGSSDPSRDFRLSEVPMGVGTSEKPEEICSGCLGLSLRREFRFKLGLPTGLSTYLTENPVQIWHFGFRSELFQTRGKLGNKAWRGFLLG